MKIPKKGIYKCEFAKGQPVTYPSPNKGITKVNKASEDDEVASNP